MSEFHSVRRLPPYVFEQVNRLKASARAAGADIIDLGMGNPDLPPPQHVIDKLCEVARKPDAARLFRRRAAFPACARRRPTITRAASA